MTDSPIRDLLVREIRERGPISFARFMQQALHHPEHGYYARGGSRLGPQGDFFTASDVGTAFGECLARQLEEMDRLLGGPDPFVVVEFGSGRGLLALDIRDALERSGSVLATRLRYVAVDASPAMREEAARRVPGIVTAAPGEPLPEGPGCRLAVELFDALPVHRVRRRGGSLREISVGLDAAGEFVEMEGDPVEQVAALARRYGAAPREGDEAEVSPAVAGQLQEVSRSLTNGFVLVVDYGYAAAELYAPAHNRGTLLAYHRHSTNEDYVSRVGLQDLTAHVNFTQLEDAARETGLDVLGRTTQDRFLIRNGILERFEPPPPEDRNNPAHARRRMQALQLIHPEGMGRVFKVLIFSRGIRPLPRLAGLDDPFRSGPKD